MLLALLLLLLCVVITVVSLCVTQDTVCGFTIEYLDLIYCNDSVRCCTTYEYVFVYTCHVLLLLLDCVLLCCCCLLLLFVHGVPECRIVAVVHCV